MKLRALELERFRKFEQPVRLSGLTDGLNVLCGPNEFGKSTLLAAIRGLLFERHSSKAEPVRRMQPLRGDAAPRLAMEFDLGHGCWRIEKRFVHKPWARLTGPDGSTFEADAAEEELQRLLGFCAAGKKGATQEQIGIWGALWVSQRQSIEQADLTSDLARSTVFTCLDSEVGVLTGSEKGQSILRAGRQQLAALVDGNGKPKGRYKDVIAAIAEKAKQLAELRDRKQCLESDCEELRTATVLRAKLENPEVITQEEAGISEARRLREAAQRFDQERAKVAAQNELAAHKVVEAQREQDAREGRRATIADNERIYNESANCVRATGEAAKAAREALAACRKAEAAAQRKATMAADTMRQRRAVLEAAQMASTLAALKSSLDTAKIAQAEIAGLGAKLVELKIDKDRLAEIHRALRERDAAHSLLRAQATDIDFEIEAAGGIRLGGAELPPGRQTVAVVSPTEIALAGIGRITVRPAIQDGERLRTRSTETQASLDRLLTTAGCSSPEEAERRHAERGEVETALREARLAVARLAPGDPSSDLKPGIEALSERVEILRLRVESDRQKLSLPESPTREVAAAAVAAADEDDRAAREALTQVRAELDAAVAADSAGRTAFMQAESQASAATTEIERLKTEESQARSRETDADLATRLAAAEGERAMHANSLAKLDTERSPDTVAAMDARIERFEQAARNRTDAIRNVREKVATLRDRITREGGAGLDENIALLDREHQSFIYECQASDRDVKVLKLLIETLATAEGETKARYLAPVTRRVTPYLERLFPGVEIACDDALRVTGITRAESGKQDFERLSDGTQEQVAVLARLAFAELLIDQGKPAMVILDDALAWSDDERIERMFDVLTDASARIQVLVLSCREDLFARLGGHRLEITPAMVSS